MPLLCEFAVTPDVFDQGSYPHEEVGIARLELLKDVFLEEALVRNLRDGEWLDVFKNMNRPWLPRWRELLKKIVKQNRLRPVDKVLPQVPANDLEWCCEALASHEKDSLTGIISTGDIVNNVGLNPVLGRIDHLGSSGCWAARRKSVRLARIYDHYKNNLELIMNSANSILFIDPHLDPSQQQYRNSCLPLLLLAQGHNPRPHIEIHRVAYVGSGPNRRFIDMNEWEDRFRREWSRDLENVNLKAEIFIWDDHHDRYLITDIIGIALGNGFDTTTNQRDLTTWNRISRDDRDDIQREFDPACNRHTLRHRFIVP